MILVSLIFILGNDGLSFAAMCGDMMNLAQAEQQQEEAVGTQEAVNAGNKICPISGEKIDEKMKAAYEYKGKIYNFCCPMCIDEFKKDPEKYIKKVEEELQAESKEESKVEEQQMEMMQEPGVSQQGMHEGHHH